MKLDLVQPFRLAGERFRSYADDLKDGVHRKVPSAALLIFLTSGRTSPPPLTQEMNHKPVITHPPPISRPRHVFRGVPLEQPAGLVSVSSPNTHTLHPYSFRAISSLFISRHIIPIHFAPYHPHSFRAISSLFISRHIFPIHFSLQLRGS
jgi:hypothetical protein